MHEDYRSQKPPRSSLAIHMQHAQDLEEADPPATHSQCVLLSDQLIVFLDEIIVFLDLIIVVLHEIVVSK